MVTKIENQKFYPRIHSIGYSVPSKKVTNNEVMDYILPKRIFNLKSKFLREAYEKAFQQSGSQVRHWLGKTESALEHIQAAATQALHNANLKSQDVDLLIFCGVCRGLAEPSQASLIQKELRLVNATSFDVLDACASWMRSVLVANDLISTGRFRNALIVNAEFMTWYRDHYDYRRGSKKELFEKFAGLTVGDAATATVITKSGKSPMMIDFRTKADFATTCQIRYPNASIFDSKDQDFSHRKDPFVLYTESKLLMKEVILLAKNHYEENKVYLQTEPDHIFLHDVSDIFTDSLNEALKLNSERVHRTHSQYGNTVSASIPLAMGLAMENGSLRVGQQVALFSLSAGIHSGQAFFKWE